MLEDFSSNVEDNATYSASAEDIAVQSCFFDIQLTSYHQGTVSHQKCFLKSIKASGKTLSENAVSLQDPESFGFHVPC
ncbi:hypothetical protein Tco_1499816 [Tanacetum coccineum]